MIPACLRVVKAPFFWIVLMAFVERIRMMDLFNSGIKILFFWRLAKRLPFPQGLNCRARVLFEYLPPIIDDLPVTAHTLAIITTMLS